MLLLAQDGGFHELLITESGGWIASIAIIRIRTITGFSCLPARCDIIPA